MRSPVTWQRVASGIKVHAMEIASHICDAFTLIGVVVLQDIFLIGATAMCLGASLLSLLFNGLAWKQGRRKVRDLVRAELTAEQWHSSCC